MLQIIGWLMCAYMVVKAFELFGNAQRKEGAALYWIGGGLSLISAPIFVLLLNAQVNNSTGLSTGLGGASSATIDPEAAADASNYNADSAASLEAMADALEAEGDRKQEELEAAR